MIIESYLQPSVGAINCNSWKQTRFMVYSRGSVSFKLLRTFGGEPITQGIDKKSEELCHSDQIRQHPSSDLPELKGRTSI